MVASLNKGAQAPAPTVWILMACGGDESELPEVTLHSTVEGALVQAAEHLSIADVEGASAERRCQQLRDTGTCDPFAGGEQWLNLQPTTVDAS